MKAEKKQKEEDKGGANPSLRELKSRILGPKKIVIWKIVLKLL